MSDRDFDRGRMVYRTKIAYGPYPKHKLVQFTGALCRELLARGLIEKVQYAGNDAYGKPMYKTKEELKNLVECPEDPIDDGTPPIQPRPRGRPPKNGYGVR